MFKLHTLIVAAALIASLATANAQFAIQSCSGSKHNLNCTTFFIPPDKGGGTARIVPVPQPSTPEEIAEAHEREAQWVLTCKPIPVLDKHGVTRMTYDQACPNGAIVGTGIRPK